MNRAHKIFTNTQIPEVVRELHLFVTETRSRGPENVLRVLSQRYARSRIYCGYKYGL